jgi:hypothetical protein
MEHLPYLLEVAYFEGSMKFSGFALNFVINKGYLILFLVSFLKADLVSYLNLFP